MKRVSFVAPGDETLADETSFWDQLLPSLVLELCNQSACIQSQKKSDEVEIIPVGDWNFRETTICECHTRSLEEVLSIHDWSEWIESSCTGRQRNVARIGQHVDISRPQACEGVIRVATSTVECA